jgi:hypothetical protein
MSQEKPEKSLFLFVVGLIFTFIAASQGETKTSTPRILPSIAFRRWIVENRLYVLCTGPTKERRGSAHEPKASSVVDYRKPAGGGLFCFFRPAG